MSSVWWVFLFTLFCIALFGFIALVWWTQKRLGLPRGGPFGRIAQWAEGVRRSEAEVKTATVGDLVLFVTLYVIGVTFVITLYIGINSGSEERSKQEIDDLTRTGQGQAQQLKGDEEELAEFRKRLNIPEQVSPAADEEIIGAHIGFRWEYGNHNSASTYVLQLMKIASGHEDELENSNVAGFDQRLPVGKLCIFEATDSTDQRARLPIQEVEARGGELGEGTYIWRVASGELNGSHDPTECIEDDQVRYWSAFRKFSFFSSRRRRIRATDEIIVGTQFSQSTPFSRVGEDGRPSGFDMDLIRVLVEGCLLNNDGVVHFDRSSCQAAVAAECDAIQARNESHVAAKVCGSTASTEGTTGAPSGTHLHMRLVPLANGANWKEALQRRNIDIYVGSLTKAKERESGDVAFSDEYLGYETEFLVDQNETCETLRCLATNNRKLGVVERTSNAWLAVELHKQEDLRTLQVVPLASFPLLETAFEKHDVAAVIVDGTMKRSLGLTSPKSLNDDLKKQRGWHAYLGDFIGHDGKEGFAMATVDDILVKRQCAIETSAKLNKECVIAAKRNLLNELNAALESDSIEMLIDVLFHQYELDQWDALRSKTRPSALQAVMGMFRQH